jgi:hypothetical protein
MVSEFGSASGTEFDFRSNQENIMSELKQAMLTGVILGAAIFAAWDAHASNAQANHGHHSGPNAGALGCACNNAPKGSAAGASGGNGGSYGDWYLKASPVDAYQPWPQAEMRQFQKP